MKKGIKWLFILAPVFVLGFIGFNMLAVHGDYHTANQVAQTMPMGRGMRGGGHMGHGGYHANAGMFMIPFIFAMVAKVAFLITGLLVWLRAKSQSWKMAGAIMVALGLFAVLPTVIALPLVLVLAYFAYKSTNNNERLHVEELVTVQDLTVPAYTNRDLLDEWEEKIRREDK